MQKRRVYPRGRDRLVYVQCKIESVPNLSAELKDRIGDLADLYSLNKYQIYRNELKMEGESSMYHSKIQFANAGMQAQCDLIEEYLNRAVEVLEQIDPHAEELLLWYNVQETIDKSIAAADERHAKEQELKTKYLTAVEEVENPVPSALDAIEIDETDLIEFAADKNVKELISMAFAYTKVADIIQDLESDLAEERENSSDIARHIANIKELKNAGIGGVSELYNYLERNM